MAFGALGMLTLSLKGTLMRLLLLSLFLSTGCQKMRGLYPLVGAGTGAAVGSIGGPGTAAAGGMVGYAAGKELQVDYSLQTAPSPSPEPIIPRLLGENDVEGIAGRLIKAQLDENQATWGDNVLREVWGIVRLVLWGGGILLVIFFIIIPVLHNHGVSTIFKRIHKELEEEIEKLKK
jgi:hypothetical protein